MPNKLPKFLDNHKICIICEGNEEYEYLKRLKDLKVWNEQYDISLVNAGGNGNIPARYQDRYQIGADELVLVFCDTEKKPPAKPVNAPLIKKYTGVENYKGRANQIQEVMEHVTEENYGDMRQRVRNLDSDDSVTGSSNFGKFLKLFEDSDSSWIEEINKKTYNQVVSDAIQAYIESKQEKGTGGDYYRTARSKLDGVFVRALCESVNSGRTSYTEAYRLTNTTSKTFSEVESGLGGVLW